MDVQGLLEEEEYQRQACQSQACPEDVWKQIRKPGRRVVGKHEIVNITNY